MEARADGERWAVQMRRAQMHDRACFYIIALIMKSNKLEMPEIYVDMRTVMDICQRGGRITRSTCNSRTPTRKAQEGKTRNHHTSILAYHGEPSLTNYLQTSNIKYHEPISNEYFAGRRLKRLSKQHLPETCLFYEKTLLGTQPTYRLRHVKLNAKKSKASQYFIEQVPAKYREANKPTLPSRSLNSQDDAGVLTAVQSLVFHLISFEEFQRIFHPLLIELKKNYKNIKLEELSRCNEERSVMAPSEEHPSEPQPDHPIDISEPVLLPSPLAEPVLVAGQVKVEEPSRNTVQPAPEEVFEVINREIAELDQAIFKRLCVGRLNSILWPCVTLQPLVGERDDLQIMVVRKFDQASKDEYRSSKDPKPDQRILQSAFEEYLDSLLDHPQERDRTLADSIADKAEAAVKRMEEARQSKVFVNLLGTHETKVLHGGFIKWEELDHGEVVEAVMRTPLRALVEVLNEHIEGLNRFRAQENSIDFKYCLFRLCKYDNQRNEAELCIPLRMEQQVKEEKKRVLVRFLKDEQSIIHQEQLLRWVQLSRLTVNLTLPKHTDQEKKFYYILGNNISVEEGLNYIYADYYYRQANFNEVLRLCYPLSDLRRVKVKEQRCISCYYQVQSLPYFRCKFCLKFCHQECTAFRSRPLSESDSTFPLDIYETENEEQLWNCPECAPCVECQMAVKRSFIQCVSCKNVYHPICGKLKGVSQEAFDEEKYTCQNCLKCRMCSTKLKSQDYCCDGTNIFCLKCYKDYTNNEYCALCMKEAHGDWVQCDQRPCEKWIHISCDNYFKQKKIIEPIEKLNYSCPSCRLLEKRKIFRNVIEELKYFDEYQYFYDPDYEELIGYKEAIKEPICIHQMREKALEGAYDTRPYQLIRADLELLVRNAMTFNMPKDEAHYRAKVLLVVGSRYLQSFRDLIECTEEYLVNHNLEDVYTHRKKIFYGELYEHYLQWLLNFRQERGVVQVRRSNAIPSEQEFFSSKIIISRIFANAQFTFRVKQKPHRIENLFTIPRLAASAWWPVRTRTCYFHPEQDNPIIFECRLCWETYCCTRTCYAHRICSACGVKGCGCDSYGCQCPPLKEKERKGYEAKIHSTLSHSKLDKREYTQYYRYCLKCVSQNLKTNWCYICHNFCYFAYERCGDCSRVYHLACERKTRWEEMACFFDSRAAFRNSYSCVRLPRTCYNCSYAPKNARHVRELLAQQARATAGKISAVGKYLPIFNYIYELNGIRLAPQEVASLLFHNYQDFLSRQKHFEEFLMNFSLVIESMGNNRICREEFKEYFMNEITRKLAGQIQHEKYISIVETRDIKELKQSKKFFKIYSKWFNNFYTPANFLNTYEIRYHLEHLTSKVNHYSGLNIGFNNIYTLMVTDHHQFTNFREENHLNSKNFERIKIESITSYVSPKSKKNIYYTNRLEKYKLHLSFLTHYYVYKARLPQIAARTNAPLQHCQAIAQEYEKYFRFHSDYENLTDCIYKEEGSKTLLSQLYHAENFNPFHESTTLVRYNPLSLYREHEGIYVNNKSEMLYKYLSSFALKIFQENKVVLRKGNTAILNENKRCWRVLKRIKGNNIEIKLEKREPHWVLMVGEVSGIVRSIEDIVRRLREVSGSVSCFEDVVEFLGFGMTDNTFYEPNHFTHLLQTLPLDSLNRKERKREVMKVYDRHHWHRQGNFTLQAQPDNPNSKFEYNVTKKELFYLKKRGAGREEEELVEPKVVPFITFQDIKKDLEDAAGPREKEHINIKEPTYDVYIAPSKIDRLGLFIRNFTRKGTVVAEYIGEVISEAMADIREQKFHFGCYMFGLGKNNTRLEIIDATFIGNMARYLNHSCDPNCKAKIELHNGHPRILIYTIRDVKQNEELTYDYQFKIDANERLICKCKSKNCQGRLT